jgi:hypothetical protein
MMNTKYLTVDKFGVLQLKVQSLTWQYENFLLKFVVCTETITPYYMWSVLILKLYFSVISNINSKTINCWHCWHPVVL